MLAREADATVLVPNARLERLGTNLRTLTRALEDAPDLAPRAHGLPSSELTLSDGLHKELSAMAVAAEAALEQARHCSTADWATTRAELRDMIAEQVAVIEDWFLAIHGTLTAIENVDFDYLANTARDLEYEIIDLQTLIGLGKADTYTPKGYLGVQ